MPRPNHEFIFRVRVIYSISVWFYGLAIGVAAWFVGKARLWKEGRENLFPRMEKAFEGLDRTASPVIWFHASSLGEFEQGRPVLEAIRKQYPQKKILLTFFSPSGYEIRKGYDQADFVFYLPADTAANARRFLAITRPEMVFFIKYDFWFNYIREINRQSIPLYYISALFRSDHYFFRWYGSWFRRQLGLVTRFFVQDAPSEQLLRGIGITAVTVAGDTRFDRVSAIAAQVDPLPAVERFCAGSKVFIAGSSWEADEAVFLPLLDQMPGMKFIIAPHDTSPARIRSITERLGKPYILYSSLGDANASGADILLVDSVGHLSKLYRYATVAFIGGGFGKGIHNIQEPVTFGVPVLFGPGYQKFREAVDLVSAGGAFSVKDPAELLRKVQLLAGDTAAHARVSAICRRYVEDHRGATGKILSFLFTET